MRNSNQIDLRTSAGVRNVTVTPGNSVQYTFDAQQSRVGANGDKPGLYNNVRAIVIQCAMTIVRSAGGTTPIYADQFPRVVKSIGLTTPMHGTMYDPSYVNGMIAKHIIEYFGDGFMRPAPNRQPIPGVDGTYTRNVEIELPFSQGWNDNPDHFNWWLGWLNESILEMFVEDAAQPFGIAGITITNVVFSSFLSMVPNGELIIPPFMATRRYQIPAAAGSNGPKLTNVGDIGSLQGFDDGARLAAMLFSHQTGGFTGSGTADQVTAIAMPWRDQAQSLNPAGFFYRFLKSGRQLNMGFDPAIVAAFDNSPPYNMMGFPGTGALNDVSARYTPLVWADKRAQISYLQKVKGNYPLDGMTFGATQSNNFNVYTRELKQVSSAKASEMISAANIDPASVVMVPKLAKKNVKPVNPSKVFCFPRQVLVKPRKAA
jgi:hypothetical protein